MDTPRLTRVLVTLVASVMVLSALVVVFDTPANHEQTTVNQTMNTINGGNTEATAGVIAVQTYSVVFQNIGLPYGTSWSVTVDGNNTLSSTGTSITFFLTNGTHTFEIAKPASYLADPGNGVIFVYGAAVVQYITFSLIEYSLTFIETGLPADSSWTVNLSGDIKTTSTDRVIYTVDNGSYAYTITGPENYAPESSTGNAVVYGSNVTVNVAFTTTLHHVTFNFQGDITGTSWELAIDGEMHTLSSSSFTLVKTNGMYDYSITPDSEYTATPSVGYVLILDSDAQVNVTITLMTYAVTFQHIGVTAGTEWSVTLGDQTLNSTSSAIVFHVPLGNYSYSISDVNGYSTTNNTGSVNVQGADQFVNVSFDKTPNYLTGTLLIIAGIAVGMAAGAGIGIMYMRRKK